MIFIDAFAGVSTAVWVHLMAAVLAIGVGPVALYRRRRDVWHKTAGYIWVGAMVVTAASSFWLPAQILPLIAGFGPIHLLSVWVFHVLFHGVQSARRGDIARHRSGMRGLYWTGLLVAGVFTLFPHRTLNRVLFPGNPEAGYWAIGLCGAALIWVILRQTRAPRRQSG